MQNRLTTKRKGRKPKTVKVINLEKKGMLVLKVYNKTES